MTIASHDDAMFDAAGGELSEDTMVINNPLVDAEQILQRLACSRFYKKFSRCSGDQAL